MSNVKDIAAGAVCLAFCAAVGSGVVKEGYDLSSYLYQHFQAAMQGNIDAQQTLTLITDCVTAIGPTAAYLIIAALPESDKEYKERIRRKVDYDGKYDCDQQTLHNLFFVVGYLAATGLSVAGVDWATTHAFDYVNSHHKHDQSKIGVAGSAVEHSKTAALSALPDSIRNSVQKLVAA